MNGFWSYERLRSFWTKINITQNRALFCLLPVLVTYMIALSSHAMYQSCDDFDMRIVLEGSALGFNFPPSEFSLFMNILYGKFLKFFYNIYQNWFWYDTFTYLFLGISFYVITLSIFKNFENETLFNKILKCSILVSVYTISFVLPQFTLTSGMLAISGILSFYMLVCSYFNGKYKYLCSFYCFFSLLFSSLIRFENCMLVSFFTLLVLIPFWAYREWKNIIKKSIIPFSALILIIICAVLNMKLIEENSNWNEAVRMNIARGELTEKMFIWDDIDNGDFFSRTIQAFSDIPDSTNYMNDFDYKLLIIAGFLTNSSMQNVDNLEYISNALSHELQNEKSISFRIKDYFNILFLMIALFVCVSLYSNGAYKIFYFVCISLIIIAVVNFFYKTLPERVWLNLAFSIITVSLFNFRIRFFSCFYKMKNIFILCFVVLLSMVSCEIVSNVLYVNNMKYSAFIQIRNDVRSLPDDYFYISDYTLMEHVSAPFRHNILENILCLTVLNMHESYQTVLGKYGLDSEEPWLEVCKKDSKIRLVYHDAEYPIFFYALKDAISYYMKKKYNITVAFLLNYKINGFSIVQCRSLSEKEDMLRKEYFEQFGNVHYYFSPYDPLKFEFIRKMWGDDLSYSEIIDAINIINAEVLQHD